MANSNVANLAPPEATIPGLADIQEPLLNNDWYLAPGWSLLLILFLALCGYAGYRWWRYRQFQKPVQLALAELAKIDVATADAAQQITQLMKRLLITRLPAHPAITLTGAAWQQFLITSLPAAVVKKLPADPLPDLLALHYQQTTAPDEIQRYAAFAALWLQKANLSAAPAMAQGVTHA